MASAYWVVPPEGKANLEKTGERRTRGYVRSRVHDEGLAGGLLRVEGERDGNEHGRDSGGATLCRIAADESVGGLPGGVLERRHGALRACRLQRQNEENIAERWTQFAIGRAPWF